MERKKSTIAFSEAFSVAQFQADILTFYQKNGRDFPWRNRHDPYAIWVSEIMLQQTRAEKVRGFFPSFLTDFPNVSALASASEDALLRNWAGLGYYQRARNMQQAAKRIMREFSGSFPSTYAEIRSLPGIGPYSAAAIASIAFRLPVAAVDANISRIFSRLFFLEGQLKSGRGLQTVQDFADSLLHRESPGTWNQALMDFGALVCLPRNPRCSLCPVSSFCGSFRKGVVDQFPERAAKKRPLTVFVDMGWVLDQDKVLIVKRGKQGVLRGMWSLPHVESSHPLEGTPHDLVNLLGVMGFSVQQVRFQGTFRHVFSHRVWMVRLFCLSLLPQTEKGRGAGGKWLTTSELRQTKLASAFQKAIQKMAGM